MGKTSAPTPAPAPAPAAEPPYVFAGAEGAGADGGAAVRTATPFTAQPHVNLLSAYRAPDVAADVAARRHGGEVEHAYGRGDTGSLELVEVGEAGAGAGAGALDPRPAAAADALPDDARNSRQLALPGEEYD